MKIQLTELSLSLLDSLKKLEALNFPKDNLDLAIAGLKDLVDEMRAVSFNSKEDVMGYAIATPILIDSPIKVTTLIRIGFEKGLLELT